MTQQQVKVELYANKDCHRCKGDGIVEVRHYTIVHNSVCTTKSLCSCVVNEKRKS
jgi:hypothetical protein